MSARDVSLAGFALDSFIRNTAEGGMDDADWRDFARLTIDLAKAEMREEIRAGVKPEPPSEPAAPQQRWEIELEMMSPKDRGESLGKVVIGSHTTEEDAYKASCLLNAILGSIYIFTVIEV